MRRILHVLPHPGGGAETFVDQLERMPGHIHERRSLATHRSPARALPGIAARYPSLLRDAHAFDLVHVHGDAAASLCVPLLRRSAGLWTTHGLHLLRRTEGAQRTAVERAVRAATRAAETTCCSEAERSELRAIGAVGELAVVPNGIDLPRAADSARRRVVRERIGLDETEMVALFVGELEERKRPEQAVQAAIDADVALLVAGSGPLDDQLRSMARGSSRVRLLGYRDDVADLMAASDVLMMPSEREGISFAVLEAMGAGLAMVVSDGPGNPEAVGDAGIVVPVADDRALAAALRALRDDTARRRALGAAARERVAAHFTADALASGIERAYVRALDRAAAAAPA